MVACATVVPGVRSFYRWERKMTEGNEALIMLKTTQRRYRALERTIETLHPYAVPEVIAIQVKKGYSPYLEWISNEVANQWGFRSRSTLK